MKRAPAFVALAFVACEPLQENVAVPASSAPSAIAPTAQTESAPRVIDVRVDFEEGNDASFGGNVTTVRGIFSVPALGVRRALFSVPYPYRCARRDEGDLAIECSGDDGSAVIAVRVSRDRIVVRARDYGRLDLAASSFAIALPPSAVTHLYAPPKLPTSY